MMLEQALVLRYQNGIATIQAFAKSGCGGCVAEGCGTKSLSALVGEKRAPQFDIAVSQHLNSGDQIEIGITENHLLLSVFWLYAVPLFVLIASTLFFSMWFANELVIAGLILCSTLVAFISIKKIIKRQIINGLNPIFVRKL